MIGISQPTALPYSFLRFQRSYLWDVLLPDIGLSVGGLVGFGVAQLVQTIQFADYSIGTPSTIRFGPLQASFAGLLETDRIRMTFLKTMPDVVSLYFNSWKKLIIADNGLYFPKANYQRNIYARFIDQTGLAVGRYKFSGAFPVKFPSYSLNYTDEKITDVPIDFMVDRVDYEAL